MYQTKIQPWRKVQVKSIDKFIKVHIHINTEFDDAAMLCSREVKN